MYPSINNGHCYILIHKELVSYVNSLLVVRIIDRYSYRAKFTEESDAPTREYLLRPNKEETNRKPEKKPHAVDLQT